MYSMSGQFWFHTDFNAQVLFERVTFDLEELQEAIRIIDKDVPRTDRDLPYYRWERVSFVQFNMLNKENAGRSIC